MIDRNDFCENIKKYEKTMYNLAYSIVRNEYDAADIISESVLRAYCNLETLKSDRSFQPWVLRIVHNTAVEFIRKNAKIVNTGEFADVPAEDTEKDIETTIVLREAVESLKQPYRTVVILFYYENLSIANIAHITGCNTVTVRQQLSRARKQLKKILKEDFWNE